MDQFTTIVVLQHKIQEYSVALASYRKVMEDMVVDSRVNNALKGHYQATIKEVESKLDEAEKLEQEVMKEGLYKSKMWNKINNK
tara:strand:+ start:1768 stop:2019 length:252 start_codon:yes stop_codon:yes gene_type:complete